MSGCGACLIYHINKRLRVVPDERTDGVTCTVTRENCLDQGGELMRSEPAPDQTFTGWELRLGKKNQGAISVPRKAMEAGLNAYRSRIQRP